MKSGLTALFPFALVVSGAVAEPKCEPPIPPRDEVYTGAIQLLVDATDIDRRIFHVHETAPVSGGKEAVLLYPEWLPGTHAPSGRNRINKVAGLIVRANGAPLGWIRDPCEVFAFRVTAPDGTVTLDVDFDYLSPDGSQTGPGGSPEVSPDIFDFGVVIRNTLPGRPFGEPNRDRTESQASGRLAVRHGARAVASEYGNRVF